MPAEQQQPPAASRLRLGGPLPAPLGLWRSPAGADVIIVRHAATSSASAHGRQPAPAASADAAAASDASTPRARSASPLDDDDSDDACRLRAAPVSHRLLQGAAAGLRPEALAALAAVAAEARGARAAAASLAAVPGAALGLAEDWKLRQFWTDEATAGGLAAELLHLARARVRGGPGAVARVACLSCPSVFKALRVLIAAEEDAEKHATGQLPRARVLPLLFEFDRRFAAFGSEFVHFDCEAPVSSLAGCSVLGAIDVFACDPPYLTADCLSAYGEAMAALRASPDAPLLLCTGAALEAPALDILGCRRTRFPVRHASRLSNPFALFVNYGDAAAEGPMGGWQQQDSLE